MKWGGVVKLKPHIKVGTHAETGERNESLSRWLPPAIRSLNVTVYISELKSNPMREGGCVSGLGLT